MHTLNVAVTLADRLTYPRSTRYAVDGPNGCGWVDFRAEGTEVPSHLDRRAAIRAVIAGIPLLRKARGCSGRAA